MSIRHLVGIFSKGEKAGHGLDVKGPVTLLFKGLSPLASQSRDLGAADRVGEQRADKVTRLIATVSETIATMKHGHI